MPSGLDLGYITRARVGIQHELWHGLIITWVGIQHELWQALNLGCGRDSDLRLGIRLGRGLGLGLGAWPTSVLKSRLGDRQHEPCSLMLGLGLGLAVQRPACPKVAVPEKYPVIYTRPPLYAPYETLGLKGRVGGEGQGIHLTNALG